MIFYEASISEGVRIRDTQREKDRDGAVQMGGVWSVDRHMGMSGLEAGDLLVPLLSLIAV